MVPFFEISAQGRKKNLVYFVTTGNYEYNMLLLPAGIKIYQIHTIAFDKLHMKYEYCFTSADMNMHVGAVLTSHLPTRVCTTDNN